MHLPRKDVTTPMLLLLTHLYSADLSPVSSADSTCCSQPCLAPCCMRVSAAACTDLWDMIYNLVKKLIEREERRRQSRLARLAKRAAKAQPSPSPSPSPAPRVTSSSTPAVKTAGAITQTALKGTASLVDLLHRPRAAAVQKPGATPQSSAPGPQGPDADSVSSAVQELVSGGGSASSQQVATEVQDSPSVLLNEQELTSTVSQLAQMDPSVLAKWAAVEKHAVVGELADPEDPSGDQVVIAAADKLARAATRVAALQKSAVSTPAGGAVAGSSIPAAAPAAAEPGSKAPSKLLRLRRMLGLP